MNTGFKKQGAGGGSSSSSYPTVEMASEDTLTPLSSSSLKQEELAEIGLGPAAELQRAGGPVSLGLPGSCLRGVVPEK